MAETTLKDIRFTLKNAIDEATNWEAFLTPEEKTTLTYADARREVMKRIFNKQIATIGTGTGMDIIQAIERARGGALIRNGALKEKNHFLKWQVDDMFYEYELSEGSETTFKYVVVKFSMADILSDDWEVLAVDPFPKEEDKKQ